ncbi:MAG: DNA mismatch repair protein MutS [Turneriella sp.]|nr:DNA mismatch repair protein MutS [Turneriella sp.]
MRQYLEIKKQYPDDILFFRMGDFYEMFLEDAVYASRVLDIALTRRQDKVPMCGVPHHSMSQYVHPILEQGRRIAICDQLENPAEAQGRIVRRGVTRILTPGSLFEESLIDAKDSRRLCGMSLGKEYIQLAIVEVATGQIWFERLSLRLRSGRGIHNETANEIVERPAPAPTVNEIVERSRNDFSQIASAFRIVEWVVSDKDSALTADEPALHAAVVRRYPIDDTAFQERVLKEALQSRNIAVWELDADEKRALTLTLAYLREISPLLKLNWASPVREYRHKIMVLDEATLRTLEILQSADGKAKPSLMGIFTPLQTAAGTRLLASYLARPSADKEEILKRHNGVESLAKHGAYREIIQRELAVAADIERVLTGLNNNPTVRHLGQVRDTLAVILRLQKFIADNRLEPLLESGWRSLDDFPTAVYALLEEALLTENLPPLLDSRRFVKIGYMPLLDELIELSENAVAHLTAYEEKQKAEHGITTLKVKHNNVLGYFIEISKGQVAKAPESYQRRQTLTNGERYTTQELKELENKILSASEEVLRLQKGVFEDIRTQVLESAASLQCWAERLARLDVLLAFARTAVSHRHIRPTIHAGKRLRAEAVRHPVIEAYFKSEMFIPNDILLSNEKNPTGENDPHLAIITGPNMAGKSTYIRQIGIMQIMAQAGAFVAALSAALPIVDRVFTRIGAHDRLSHGESTFFVEMAECARIFRNATPDSLILLDEVGRGTSTYDGISIAQAMIEELNEERSGRPKTLFATHYSELAHLISKERGIQGLTVSVVEKAGQVFFMRKIVEGVAEKSFGIHVADMAGMPKSVTKRAQEILMNLEKKADFLLAEDSYARGEKKPARSTETLDDKQGELF